MKREKRSNPPTGMAAIFGQSPEGSTCGICRAPAGKRISNSWRVIDLCSKQECAQQGHAWVSNSPYTRRVAPIQKAFRKATEFKFLSNRDPAFKAPSRRAAR